MLVWARIHSLAFHDLEEFYEAGTEFGIAFNPQKQPGLLYRIKEADLKTHDPSDWAFIWIKMSSFVETISIANFGNHWLDDRVWHEGQIVWQRPPGVPLVEEKEGHPEKPQLTIRGPYLAAHVINLMYHIATTFPRVWPYHTTGCYLLRSAFIGRDFNADILLNFFKIGELITATMYKTKPHLKQIQQASRELGVDEFYSDKEIAGFYRIRSRDAAHDWLKVQPVERSEALDCKLWSETMIQYHWQQKGVRAVQVIAKTQSPSPASPL